MPTVQMILRFVVHHCVAQSSSEEVAPQDLAKSLTLTAHAASAMDVIRPSTAQSILRSEKNTRMHGDIMKTIVKRSKWERTEATSGAKLHASNSLQMVTAYIIHSRTASTLREMGEGSAVQLPQ
jgi:hypothetical protein